MGQNDNMSPELEKLFREYKDNLSIRPMKYVGDGEPTEKYAYIHDDYTMHVMKVNESFHDRRVFECDINAYEASYGGDYMNFGGELYYKFKTIAKGSWRNLKVTQNVAICYNYHVGKKNWYIFFDGKPLRHGLFKCRIPDTYDIKIHRNNGIIKVTLSRAGIEWNYYYRIGDFSMWSAKSLKGKKLEKIMNS